MQTIQVGDHVQFRYHDQMREGTVERTWSPKKRAGSSSGGFCVDHGGCYKSYNNSKVKFLAKVK